MTDNNLSRTEKEVTMLANLITSARSNWLRPRLDGGRTSLRNRVNKKGWPRPWYDSTKTSYRRPKTTKYSARIGKRKREAAIKNIMKVIESDTLDTIIKDAKRNYISVPMGGFEPMTGRPKSPLMRLRPLRQQPLHTNGPSKGEQKTKRNKTVGLNAGAGGWAWRMSPLHLDGG